MVLGIFIVLLVLICINVPIAVALAVAAVVGLAVTEGVGSLVTVALDMYDGSTKFSLIAIPMFATDKFRRSADRLCAGWSGDGQYWRVPLFRRDFRLCSG